MARTVLIIHSSADLYGADRQLLAIASGLDRARHRPLVVLPERGELAPLLEESGTEVVVRPLAVLRRRLLSAGGLASLGGRLAADRRALASLARDRDVALVHSNTSVVLGGHQAARRAGIPHLVHVREIYAGAGGAVAALLWPALHRRLSTADGLACVSAAVASQFAEVSSAFVLHDGLPRVPRPRDRGEARAALGLPPGPFVVALLGRVSDWKGQDVLARALAEPALAEIGAIGALAGAPYAGNEPLERDLTRLGLELGLGERLQLLGFREDIDTVLGAADAVAVPSTRPDPFPNAALEAAAAGIPVVASSHGGLVEIVRDRATGLLVEPGDHRALAEALRALADDPELRRRLGSAAAVDARERFGIERMLAELQDRYDRLIESAG